jgi:hypothetical protein
MDFLRRLVEPENLLLVFVLIAFVVLAGALLLLLR